MALEVAIIQFILFREKSDLYSLWIRCTSDDPIYG